MMAVPFVVVPVMGVVDSRHRMATAETVGVYDGMAVRTSLVGNRLWNIPLLRIVSSKISPPIGGRGSASLVEDDELSLSISGRGSARAGATAGSCELF